MVRILSAALVGAAFFVAAPASAAALPAAALDVVTTASTDVGYYAPRRRPRCYVERRRIRTDYGYEFRNVRICPRRDY